MKFLGDMGVSISTIAELRHFGHDAVHLRELDRITMPDDEILDLASRQGRIVLTFDLDFGTLLAHSGKSHPSVVIFRLRNQTPDAVNPRLLQVLQECESALAAGVLVVVDDDGYRVRRLPILPSGRIQ